MRPGALGSLQRGVLNLRANRELIALAWLQRLLLVALSVLSLLPFYWVLDLRLPGRQLAPDELLNWIVEAAERLLGQMATVPFWMAVVASSALLALVLFVYSFFEAGAFGVLAAGERRSPAADASPLARPPAGFRCYTWKTYQEAGGAYLWRFFWLMNLLLLFWTVWLLLVSVAALTSGFAAGSAGVGAALALGCLSVLPLAFVAMLLVFWGWFAQAEIVCRDRGVWPGLLGGLRLATRRLGTMIGLAVVLTLLVAGSAVVFLLLTLTLDTALASFGAIRVALGWSLQALQWLVSGVIHLTFSAAILAIVRADYDLLATREVAP